MTEVDSRFVKRGFWVNLSQGPIMGQTITTDTKTGTIVIALLAISTTLAMSHLWHIVTFIWHQARANGRPANGLLRQQQALFRTLPPPSSVMADFIKLFFTWKKELRAPQALRQSLLPILAALVFTLGSIAASIFASFAVAGSNVEVLVSSPLCGLVVKSNDFGHSYDSRVASLRTEYANECYKNGDTPPTRCNSFHRAMIPFTIENASCPFSPERCLSSGVALDTNLLDLNRDFGMNLADKDKVRFRRKSTCAVLSTQGLLGVVDAEDLPHHYLGRKPSPQEKFLSIHLGTRNDTADKFSNLTFGLSLNNPSDSSHFTVIGITYSPSWHFPGFQVIPELRFENATTSISVIEKSRGVRYIYPVDDPLFSAHQEQVILNINTGDNITMYISDEIVSLIGCKDEYQFCMALADATEKCTEPGELPENLPEYFETQGLRNLNSIQGNLVKLLEHSLARSQYNDMNTFNVTTSLITANGHVGYLPDDQWIKELWRWQAISLAGLQILLSDYAIGPAARSSNVAVYESLLEEEGGRQLCSKQKMRKPGGFVNINVFALAFVLSFSFTITVLDLVLLRFLIYLSKFRAALSPRIDEWIQDSVFQLQRRAYETNGEGTWKDVDKEVPTTTGAEQLSVLSLNARPAAPATPTMTTHSHQSLAPQTPQSSASQSFRYSMTPSVYSQSTLGTLGSQTPYGSSVPLAPGPSRSPSPILPASPNSAPLPTSLGSP